FRSIYSIEPLFIEADGVSIFRLQSAVFENPVVKNRRLDKEIKDIHHHSDKEDDELHRDLEQSVEHQTQAAVRHRCASQVPANLRLIRTEVRQEQEHAGNQARPDIVAVSDIEFEIHEVEFSHLPRDPYRIDKTNVRRDKVVRQYAGEDHTAHDHRHLLTL